MIFKVYLLLLNIAKTQIYACESYTTQLANITITPQQIYSVKWSVSSSSGNITNDLLIASFLNANTSVPPMTFLYGNIYTIIASASAYCNTSTKSIKLTIASYTVTKLTTPSPATILSWWQDEGALLGCVSCSASSSSGGTTTAAPIPICSACGAFQTLSSSGACSCSESTQYMDLTNLPYVSCRNKIVSSMAWTLLKKSPSFEMEMSFSDGFASELSYNLDYMASIIKVTAQDQSSATATISIQQFNATSLSNSKNLSLSFVIIQDIQENAVLTVRNISLYNQVPFTPFLIGNLNLTYNLPGITYLSPQMVTTIATVGGAVSGTMQLQSATSSILPILTGGISTTAIILIGFLSEIDIYKYINVTFPENFVLFCQKIGDSILPNIFVQMDANNGSNPNSTIGKFAFWGVSTVMLDNSFSSITKELGVLVILPIPSLFAYALRRSPDVSQIFSKIRDLLMWNLFLSFYFGDFTELQLNSMIQLRENYVSSTYARLSYALAVIIVTTYAGLMIYIGILLNWKRKASPVLVQNKRSSKASHTTRRNSKLKSSVLNVPEKKFSTSSPPPPLELTLKRCSIVIEDFNTNNVIAKNFMLVNLGQNLLVIFILFFFQNNGIMQAVLYTILTSAYIALLIIKRPYKSRVQTAILILNNICKIIMGIVAALLGINEKTSIISQNIITHLGSVLIYMIMGAIGLNSLIGLAMTVYSIYQQIRQRIRTYRERKASQKKTGKTEKSMNDPEMGKTSSTNTNNSSFLFAEPKTRSSIKNNELNRVKQKSQSPKKIRFDPEVGKPTDDKLYNFSNRREALAQLRDVRAFQKQREQLSVATTQYSVKPNQGNESSDSFSPSSVLEIGDWDHRKNKKGLVLKKFNKNDEKHRYL